MLCCTCRGDCVAGWWCSIVAGDAAGALSCCIWRRRDAGSVRDGVHAGCGAQRLPGRRRRRRANRLFMCVRCERRSLITGSQSVLEQQQASNNVHAGAAATVMHERRRRGCAAAQQRQHYSKCCQRCALNPRRPDASIAPLLDSMRRARVLPQHTTNAAAARQLQRSQQPPLATRWRLREGQKPTRLFSA